MIFATFTGSSITAGVATGGARTVAGQAVPYGIPGRVSDGRTVIFHPGALDATARPVLLRDHNRTQPIGRVTDAADLGDQLTATARISATRDGNDALVLAADGALGAFSVGVDPIDWHTDDAGVLHVTAGDWQELSLLTFGAFDTARVSTVTATQQENSMLITASDQPAPDDVEDVEDVDTVEEEEAPEIEAARPVPVTAARRHPSARPGRPAAPDVSIAQLAQMITASRFDQGVAATVNRILAAQGAASIEAALVDVTLVGANNVASAYRPAYQAELVEIIGWGTPMVDALRQGDLQRGDYPNKTFTTWTNTPKVALQAAEKTAINSSTVSIAPASVPVKTWAGGNDISQQTLDLGSPSFVEDYIRAAGVDYAKVIDTYACTTLLAAAANVATVVGDSFIAVVGKLIGALSPATTPPGGLFLGVSNDVGVGLIGVKDADGPAFWDGNVSFGSFTPTVNAGGLSVFVDPNLPARTYLLGHRQGATWYDLPGTPFNLRAVNVGLLGLDVAVYGYGALGIQYPGAFTKTTQPSS